MENGNSNGDKLNFNEFPFEVISLHEANGNGHSENVSIKYFQNGGSSKVVFKNGKETVAESADVEPETGEDAKSERKCWERFLGMAIMTIGSVFFSLSVTIVKVFSGYQVYTIAMWRFFGGCFLPSLPILFYLQYYKKSQPFQPIRVENKAKTIGFLCGRAITGIIATVLQYSALKYLSVSDCTVISFSTPVFVTFLACLLLGETFGGMNIVAALCTLIGVTIITRPTFLTGEKEMDTNMMIGVSLALTSMVFSTFVFLTLRVLKDVNFSVVTLFFGSIGTLSCIILSEIFGSVEIPVSLWDWFLAFLLCSLTFSGQGKTILAVHPSPLTGSQRTFS